MAELKKNYLQMRKVGYTEETWKEEISGNLQYSKKLIKEI